MIWVFVCGIVCNVESMAIGVVEQRIYVPGAIGCDRLCLLLAGMVSSAVSITLAIAAQYAIFIGLLI